MANETKNFLDYAGLQSYDAKIKNYIDTEDAKSIKFAKISADGNNLLLYKSKTAGAQTPEASADYTIPMGSEALRVLVTSLGTAAGAVLNGSETQYSAPTFTGDIAAATSIANACQLLDTHIGTLASLTTTEKTNIVGAINEIVSAIADLDVDEFALAEKDASTNVVTIHGISENEGKIAVGVDTANDVTLAAVAATGAAEDVTTSAITDGAVEPTTLYPAGNAQGVFEAIARDLNNLTTDAAVTVYSPSSSDYAAVYEFYQGDDGTHAAAKKIGTINIPKDMVVSAGSVVNIVFVEGTGGDPDTLHEGSASGPDVTEAIKGAGVTPTEEDAGKYIKLTISNATLSSLYIPAKALVDIYTGGSTAEITVSVDNSTNVITATIVEIDSSKIVYKTAVAPVYTQVESGDTFDEDTDYYTKDGDVYTKDTTVTAENFAAKVAEGLYVLTTPARAKETVKQALERLDAEAADVETKITTAINALDATAIPFATYTAGTSGAADTIVINGGVKEIDGVIEAGGGDTVTLQNITTAQIDALFNVAVTGVTVSPKTVTLAPDGTQQLTATVAPNDATNKAVTYSSSDNAVATVSESGLITAIGLGEATITVTTTDGSFTDTSTVTVSNS